MDAKLDKLKTFTKDTFFTIQSSDTMKKEFWNEFDKCNTAISQRKSEIQHLESDLQRVKLYSSNINDALSSKAEQSSITKINNILADCC